VSEWLLPSTKWTPYPQPLLKIIGYALCKHVSLTIQYAISAINEFFLHTLTMSTTCRHETHRYVECFILLKSWNGKNKDNSIHGNVIGAIIYRRLFCFIMAGEAWYIPNMGPSIVRGQTFSIVMGFELTTIVVTCTDYIGSYKSNYHTITTTTAPVMGGNYWSGFIYNYSDICTELRYQYIMRTALLLAKTDWLGIRIMCTSGATCLFADICFSELALWKSN